MAEVTIRCPHCKAELTVEEEWGGMEVCCSLCNKNFIVELPPPESRNDSSIPQADAPESALPATEEVPAAFVEARCPHCHTKMVVERRWLDGEITCSTCKKNFTVNKGSGPRPPTETCLPDNNSFTIPQRKTPAVKTTNRATPPPPPPSFRQPGPSATIRQSPEEPQPAQQVIPPKNCSWTRRYRWGFTVMKACQVLAVGIVLLGCVLTYFRIDGIVQQVNKRWKPYKLKAQALADKEKDFVKSYLKTVNMLQSSGNAGRAVSGFSLSPNLLNPKAEFNYTLLSNGDLEQSRQALRQYDSYIEGLADCIRRDLLKFLPPPEAAAPAPRPSRPTVTRMRPRDRTLDLSSRKGQEDFYADPAETDRLLKKFQEYLKGYGDAINKEKNNMIQRRNLQSLSGYLTFMRENLFVHKSEIRVSGNSGVFTDGSQNTNSSFEPARELSRDGRMRKISSAFIEDLTETDGWELKKSCRLLNTSLDQLSSQYVSNNLSDREDFKALTLWLIIAWSSTLAAALFILVTSDVLKGFFDIACNSFNCGAK